MAPNAEGSCKARSPCEGSDAAAEDMRRMHSPTPYTRRVSAHAKACRLGRSAKALHMHAPTPTPLYTWPSLSHIAHTRAHT